MTVELQQLQAELGKAQEPLTQQAEIRQQEAEAFHEAEVEMLESIHMLSHALAVLSGHCNEPEPGLSASEEQEDPDGDEPGLSNREKKRRAAARRKAHRKEEQWKGYLYVVMLTIISFLIGNLIL